MTMHQVLSKLSSKWLLAAAVALPLAGPSLASAGDRDDRNDRDRRDDRHDGRRDDRPKVDLNIRIGEPGPPRRVEERRIEERRVWVPPVYRTVTDKRFIEPVVRTVVDKRFIEPEYSVVYERIEVPAIYETRETRYREGWTWRVRIERVLVRPARFDVREKRVCVREGRWETVERQEVVSEGRWETTERQELVAEGHYDVQTETIVERRPVEPVNPFFAGFNLRLKK